MSMLEILWLFFGFIIIIKASDILVDCASSLALRCHIPKMLIALTIVSFGTCAPEIAISFQSIAAGNETIAFSNVIGSCVVNVFLIVGLASIIRPIKIKHATIKKELPLLFLITTAFTVMMIGRYVLKSSFTRVDAILLLILFCIFILYLIQMIRKKKENEEDVKTKYNIPLSLILLVVSIFFITLSSDVIVNSAITLAERFSISEKLITMVAIVIGTSLPELFMTISSARKGEFDMALGNIIGTNIFNICIVLGLPITIYGAVAIVNFNLIDMIMVFLTSLFLYIFAKSDRVISKREGIAMVLLFSIYYLFIFFHN